MHSAINLRHKVQQRLDKKLGQPDERPHITLVCSLEVPVVDLPEQIQDNPPSHLLEVFKPVSSPYDNWGEASPHEDQVHQQP